MFEDSVLSEFLGEISIEWKTLCYFWFKLLFYPVKNTVRYIDHCSVCVYNVSLLGHPKFISVFELQYAIAAIIALVHDVLVTMGAFSLLDKEFTLVIVAAFLTIIGYSLNDTIVVFDRIRENMRRKGKSTLTETINASINQTLSRTLLTSGTTMLVVVALFFFGGEIIHDFSFALLIGVLVGTYSSIFIASVFLVYWDSRKKA